MKRTFYIFCFSVLGGMVGFLFHAFIEALILAALIQSSTGIFFSMDYNQWAVVHAVGTPLLVIVGVLVGFIQGKHWWVELYVKTQHRW